jgi:hypothetical protein
MTPAQLSALKAAAQADPNVLQNFADGNDQTVADYYNALDASRSVWRPQIMLRELNTAITWSDFAALTVAKQNAYLAMTQGGYVDGSAANVRSGFTTVFGSPSTSLTALTAIAQRQATRLEALDAFWTTTGGAAPNSGVTTVFGVRLTATDVSQARVS